ncbi:conserved hypothetical protein [Beutenbergia cavernae DSM 12333]|uniref:Methionine synthase n=1 Tax=Beutenbergia cavernae (strain ATCC BAA-8 / DSM 12333 / CCUG 43141 / JCM 11478 / NBRC 16432 / NCIMB 13614 / HKI 0122) TaxID=471853 RepID=C5C2D7_BEUC1|nr:hypothetical protein [Beutenbergia cavernae]ACQ79623.1 conserved hypothetical protein [Beutenbergia cavernae DSM 12333]
MTGIGGLGPWPGTEPFPAQQQVLDVLAAAPSGVEGIPHLVTLPGRGPGGEAVGRALALSESMPATLEPHGWRLGLVGDHTLRRARSWLAEDVEALGLAASGYSGPLALPVLGPWTLAASTWLPRGERVVSDAVAVRDVVAALAAGVLDHLAAVSRALSWATILGGEAPAQPPGEPAAAGGAPRFTVVLAEPRLDAVLHGAVSSFSGVSRLASVEPGVVAGAVRTLVEAWADVADVVVVAPGDAETIRTVRSAGVAGLALDVPRLGGAAWDAVGEAIESGLRLWAGVAPARGDGAAPRPDDVAQVLLEPWRRLGLASEGLDAVVLTPRSGLAGASPAAARATLDDVARAAAALGELVA